MFVLKYLQVLIVINQICWPNCPKISEELVKIQEDPDYQFKYIFLSEESKFNEMFGINPSKDEQGEN